MKSLTHISAAGFEIRTAVLLNMEQSAFESYVFRLADYLLSEDSVGDADAASAFLQVLTARAQIDRDSIVGVYERLLPALSHVAGSQAWFDASHADHGDFSERARELASICGRDVEELTGGDQMLDPTDDA